MPTKKQYPARKREWYLRNKQKQISAINTKKRTLRSIILAYKQDKPCADCRDFFPPYVMDFDHRPGTVKFCDPAQLHKYGSLRRLHDELAKCDLVCANCHRMRTHRRAQ